MEEKAKRSDIWLHFTIVSTGLAKCNICASKYSYKGGSTSNLKKHLLTKHHTVLQKTVSTSEEASSCILSSNSSLTDQGTKII